MPRKVQTGVIMPPVPHFPRAIIAILIDVSGVCR
jgi:hypothetical protein